MFTLVSSKCELHTVNIKQRVVLSMGLIESDRAIVGHTVRQMKVPNIPQVELMEFQMTTALISQH